MALARLLVVGIVLALSALAGAAQAGTASPWIPIGCRENAQVADPVRVDPRRYRVVAGKVALPSSKVVQQAVRAPEGDEYPYWAKLGLLLRIGSGPVDVRLPAAWRGRATILWGYANLHDPGAWLRLEGCPLPRVGKPWSQWIAYAGGVSVKRPACVPLLVSAGGRTERVELAIGRRCA